MFVNFEKSIACPGKSSVFQCEQGVLRPEPSQRFRQVLPLVRWQEGAGPPPQVATEFISASVITSPAASSTFCRRESRAIIQIKKTPLSRGGRWGCRVGWRELFGKRLLAKALDSSFGYGVVEGERRLFGRGYRGGSGIGRLTALRFAVRSCSELAVACENLLQRRCRC